VVTDTNAIEYPGTVTILKREKLIYLDTYRFIVKKITGQNEQHIDCILCSA
jgi:hypothetical protein